MLPEAPSKASEPKPARLRVPMLIFAALVIFAAIVFSLVRSHPDRPSSPAANQLPVPAGAPPDQSAAPTPEPANSAALRGAVAQRVLPDVPERALRTIHGTVDVKIRVAVDLAGNASTASIESAGPSRYFASLALKAAQSWRFKPAEAGGHAVPSVWTLQFKFRQSGTEVIPVETAP